VLAGCPGSNTDDGNDSGGGTDSPTSPDENELDDIDGELEAEPISAPPERFFFQVQSLSGWEQPQEPRTRAPEDSPYPADRLAQHTQQALVNEEKGVRLFNDIAIFTDADTGIQMYEQTLDAIGPDAEGTSEFTNSDIADDAFGAVTDELQADASMFIRKANVLVQLSYFVDETPANQALDAVIMLGETLVESWYEAPRATATADESVHEPAFGTDPGAQRIDANPEAGFHSPYFLYTPETPDSATDSVNNSLERPLLVQVHPWGDFEDRVSNARNGIQNGVLRADRMNCPALLAPLTFNIEGAFLRRDDPDPRQERVDLQLLAMIDDAKSRLSGGAYTVADQIHCGGGSSAGVFMDAFAALHPGHVNVFSSGANGIAFLPFEQLSDDFPTFGNPGQQTVPWPLGAGEVDELANKEFDRDAWMEIDQFRWIGAEDQDPENPDNYVHKLYRGSDEIDQLVEEIFGTLQVDHRFETSRQIYNHLEVPATFTVFEGAGHVPESEHFAQIMEFHQRKIAEHFELIHLIPQPPATESRVGETVTVPVTAENHTSVASETTATLSVEGTKVDTVTVELGPNSKKIVELETTFEDTGEFTLSVNGTAIGDPVVVS
jgi:hypothetical protein